MPKPVYAGRMDTIDAAQDALSAARSDWVKNDRVSRAIRRAMKEIVRARGMAAEDINRSSGISAKIR